MSENVIVREVMEYFEKRGDFPVRTNNIAVKGRTIHKSAKGLPDIHVYMKGGKVCIVETKCTTKQSDDQKEFQRKVESRGHTYILAYKIEDVIERLG